MMAPWCQLDWHLSGMLFELLNALVIEDLEVFSVTAFPGWLRLLLVSQYLRTLVWATVVR